MKDSVSQEEILSVESKIQSAKLKFSFSLRPSRIIFLISYFLIVPLSIFFLILYSLFLQHEKAGSSKRMSLNLESRVQFSALPENFSQTEASLGILDARVTVLQEFFERYNSPLLPHARKIVEVADEYKLDYRLLPAIAMQESGLCKKAPENSFNCWGYGIYGKKVIRFDNYEDGIETVSKNLSKKYLSQGFEEVHEIVQKYTPRDDGTWVTSVNYFMDQIGASL